MLHCVAYKYSYVAELMQHFILVSLEKYAWLKVNIFLYTYIKEVKIATCWVKKRMVLLNRVVLLEYCDMNKVKT